MASNAWFQGLCSLFFVCCSSRLFLVLGYLELNVISVVTRLVGMIMWWERERKSSTWDVLRVTHVLFNWSQVRFLVYFWKLLGVIDHVYFLVFKVYCLSVTSLELFHPQLSCSGIQYVKMRLLKKKKNRNQLFRLFSLCPLSYFRLSEILSSRNPQSLHSKVLSNSFNEEKPVSSSVSSLGLNHYYYYYKQHFNVRLRRSTWLKISARMRSMYWRQTQLFGLRSLF